MNRRLFNQGRGLRNTTRWARLAVLAAGLSACQPPTQPEAVTGSSLAVDQSEGAMDAPADDVEQLDEKVVNQAARHFSGLRVADKLKLNEEELVSYLASADAICVGERHNSALDHYAQLQVLRGLADRRELRGFELGLALEMVTLGSQHALNEYLAGRSEREQFLLETDWNHNWGFPIQLYDPLLLEASYEGVRGLAIGVPRQLSHFIAMEGLAALSGPVRRKIPELDLGNQEHRKLFESLMGDHPLPEGTTLDHFYEAQVVWDESMARSSRQWLLEHRPLRKLVIFAGIAHCHRSAIPSRLERENDLVVVNLITADKQPNQSDPVDSVSQLLYDGYEYQIVFE